MEIVTHGAHRTVKRVNLVVDALEPIQVSQVGSRNGDRIARLADERRLARENGIGIEGHRATTSGCPLVARRPKVLRP